MSKDICASCSQQQVTGWETRRQICIVCAAALFFFTGYAVTTAADEQRSKSADTAPVNAVSENNADAVNATSAGPENREEWFETRVRPVLTNRCLKCHGADKQSGSLRLDSKEHILMGGDRGPAIVDGDAESSLLIQAVKRTNPDLQMPPDDSLSGEEIADLSEWIRQGAFWPAGVTGNETLTAAAHWAFQPVQPPEIPVVPNALSSQPIDRLIAVGYRSQGLSPVPAADRRTLIRRPNLDVTGLLPTSETLQKYVSDPADDAQVISRLIDELLADPAYGERWGRYWMDVVRYADTAGDNADYPIPEVRRYRDYIIDSLNADKPFDRFVQEQLAGDLIARDEPDKRSELITATGYLALSRRYATAPYELWHLTLEDTIDSIGRGLLGITVRCARCHDHKFDPVTMQDYYALYGIFDSTKFPYAGSEEYQSMKQPRQGFVPLAPEQQVAEAALLHAEKLKQREQQLQDFAEHSEESVALRMAEQQLASLQANSSSIAATSSDQQQALSIHELQAQIQLLQKAREKARRRLDGEVRALKQQGVPEGIPSAYAVQEGTPHDVAMQLKGDVAQPGPIVLRGVPAFLKGMDTVTVPADQSGRLELARWITSRHNPLFARVLVNRIWLQHFGTALVSTPSNFGLRGEQPTNQPLLDYLAWRLIEQGWSMKSLHREILQSKTWQLSGASDSHNAAIDPDNRLYWKHDRRRLDAECLRDTMLQVSGLLDRSRPAEHPFPEPSRWNWTQHNPFRDRYDSTHRSVYLMTQRLQRHPYLALFDGPDTNSSVEQRTQSTVPLQTLYLLNSPELQQLSAAFSQRIRNAESDDVRRIQWAFQEAYGRPPSATDLESVSSFLKNAEQQLAGEQKSDHDVRTAAWNSVARLLLISNEFLYCD